MEFSKITICRQDVVVLSDTDPNEETNVKKKKKSKTRIECVRKVKITNITANRIAPFCYRQKCRNAQNYHRVTSKNTKYTSTRKTRRTPRKKKVLGKRHKNKDKVMPKQLCSPITVESSSDVYENISECSFHPTSSDSDEIEELIKTTRKRMKKENGQFNNRLANSVFSTVTPDDHHEKVMSDNETCNSSLHSMDTVVIESEVLTPSSPTIIHSSGDDNIDIVKKTNHDMEQLLTCRDTVNNNIDVHQKSSRSIQDNGGDVSPIYEISGKVLMEHYLNTSFVCGETNN